MILKNARKKLPQRRAETWNNEAQCGAYFGIGYVGDGVGCDISGVGRLGSGARSWDLCTFTLVVLPNFF